MRDKQPAEREPDETVYRCLLCEAIIEIGDYDTFIATGTCRYCHEAVEDPPKNGKKAGS